MTVTVCWNMQDAHSHDQAERNPESMVHTNHQKCKWLWEKQKNIFQKFQAVKKTKTKQNQKKKPSEHNPSTDGKDFTYPKNKH